MKKNIKKDTPKVLNLDEFVSKEDEEDLKSNKSNKSIKSIKSNKTNSQNEDAHIKDKPTNTNANIDIPSNIDLNLQGITNKHLINMVKQKKEKDEKEQTENINYIEKRSPENNKNNIEIKLNTNNNNSRKRNNKSILKNGDLSSLDIESNKISNVSKNSLKNNNKAFVNQINNYGRNKGNDGEGDDDEDDDEDNDEDDEDDENDEDDDEEGDYEDEEGDYEDEEEGDGGDEGDGDGDGDEGDAGNVNNFTKNSKSNKETHKNKSPLSREELHIAKKNLLVKLERLNKKGYIPIKKYSMCDNYENIKEEYERLNNEKMLNDSISTYRSCLIGLSTIIEYGNTYYDPFDIKLSGWSESVYENISDYDDVFEELYYKYGKKFTTAPEIKLLCMFFGSGLMFHLSKSFFEKGSNSAPEFNDVMNSNPELKKQYQESAMRLMNKNVTSKVNEQNTGNLGGIMNFFTNMMKPQETANTTSNVSNMTRPPTTNQNTSNKIIHTSNPANLTTEQKSMAKHIIIPEAPSISDIINNNNKKSTKETRLNI